MVVSPATQSPRAPGANSKARDKEKGRDQEPEGEARRRGPGKGAARAGPRGLLRLLFKVGGSNHSKS